MADNEPFWKINYGYVEEDSDKQKKPVLGIVHPIARGTKAHESRKITPEEAAGAPLPIPTPKTDLDADEITRLVAPIIKPGTPPKK